MGSHHLIRTPSYNYSWKRLIVWGQGEGWGGSGNEEGGGCEDDMKGNFGLGGLRSG